MTNTETLKQALEALESCTPADTSTGHVVWPSYDEQAVAQAITDLDAAIEAAEKPLAWADEIIADLHALYDSEMITENDSGDALIRLDAAICAVEEAEERHTTPPAQEFVCSTGLCHYKAQRQPLTDDRIGQIIEQCKITLVNYCSGEKQTEFARAIEAAHGITGEKK